MNKNNSKGGFLPNKHFLLIMRTTLILLFTCVFCSLAELSYTQNARVTINKRNVALSEVLSEIEKQTDYLFIYNNEVNSNEKVTVSAKQKAVSEVLNSILKDKDMTYSMEGNHILLSAKEKSDSQEKSKLSNISQQQRKQISGVVLDEDGIPVIGANIVEIGTTNGTITDIEGNFSLQVANGATLRVSYIGYLEREINIGNQTNFRITLEEDTQSLDELIVVGYGVQKKSDITGAVASLDNKRLEMLPNTNVAQAIQGAIPGVIVRSSSAGAAPEEVIMIRGRNSILASNDPLIVLDGIPYNGQISDINPNNIKSIEVLKDASSAAIYGSRGANGVILITSKEGIVGKPVISYDGSFSVQKPSNLPDLMNGEEFYNFKMKREPEFITNTEKQVYESGQWVDWIDLSTRTGNRSEHNVSASGGSENVKYFVSGGYLGVKGIRVNDDYQRVTTQINLDMKMTDWLTLGTRTILSFDDKSGQAPDTGVWRMNPLSRPYDENGNLTIYPWEEDVYFENPLEPTLFDDLDKSYQVVSNNYAIVNFPFIKGLSYRANLGVMRRSTNIAWYAGRNTATGFEDSGRGNTSRGLFENNVMENIINYNKEIGLHSLAATAVYSFEQNKNSRNSMNAYSYPHDFLSWYAADQAEVVNVSHSFNQTVLLSQMLRLNYSYDSRYLATLTARRDGFSGFGEKNKWGIFPSAALGWNVSNESFYPGNSLVSDLKLRLSYGLNGNQAVGAYETIAKLGAYDIIQNKQTLPGYVPISLGLDNLGWESSKTLNMGLDFGAFSGKVTGSVNYYNTRTSDLLLNRTISAIHGITEITQNIGVTQNTGLEVSLFSRNISSGDFRWTTSGNMTFMKNKIVSLYGYLDENGKEIDDINNAWFIGKPIRVNYNYHMIGVWQLGEEEEAAVYNSKPGYVKFKDVNKDGQISADFDREIIGQQDPKFIWGMNNTFSYKNLNLDVFVHGVHGVTRGNELMVDDVYATVRRNTINKNWWTPQNPTNDFYANDKFANSLEGDEHEDWYFENASFIRIKNVTLSYDFSNNLLSNIGLAKLRLFVTGSNLFTFTEWRGMDPELDEQRESIYQKEVVFGVSLGF